MYKDSYELEVTCSSEAALQNYLAGVECALRFDEPGITELRAAVAADDNFALGHATLARQLLIHGFKKPSKTHMQKAVSLADKASSREQSAIRVMDHTARHDSRAMEMVQAHVKEYPQDVVVLSYLVGPFGIQAFSGHNDWCQQNIDLLKTTKAAYRADDWWHITTSGFFAAESGNLEQARADCEQAWSIDPNGNCAHSLAHFHFEAGVLDEGRAFIEDWIPKFSDRSDMRHHMFWHLSLLDIEDGVPADAIYPLYDRELDHKVCDPMPLTTFSDNASFLWRSLLSGVEVGQTECEELWEYAEQHYPRYGFGFADIHRIMAAVMHPDLDKRRECFEKLHAVAIETGNRSAECLDVYAHGFGAVADKMYAEAADLLEPVVADSVLLGGSNPQRGIVEDTYLAACLQANRFSEARKVLLGRDRKNSTFDKKLLKRIEANE